MASYESFLPDIIPMVPGCPDTLIENNIRSATIELCEKAEVYQRELDPITTVEGIYEYDLEAPSGTSVDQILWATYEGNDLEPITSALLEQRRPKWRLASYSGTPEYFVQQSRTAFYLAPIPDTTKASSLQVRAVLKPTHRSTSCDDDIMNDYKDTIVNGTLFRLLRMPSKDWTDYAGAQVYATLFNQLLTEAKERGKGLNARVVRKVRYGGSGTNNTRLTRRKYGGISRNMY